jgi:hypothetical protein
MSNHARIPVFALAFAVAISGLSATAHAQHPVRATAAHAAMSGAWTGTLRYRDYQDSTRFVTLPTLLDGALATDSSRVTLAFTYDDGPGKTVRSSDRFALDATMRRLEWGPSDGKRPATLFTVTSQTQTETIQLALESDGMDDNRPARIRESIELRADGMRILKEVRFTGATVWLFRHEYTFARRNDSARAEAPRR